MGSIRLELINVGVRIMMLYLSGMTYWYYLRED
jgi:hypothetical protein